MQNYLGARHPLSCSPVQLQNQFEAELYNNKICGKPAANEYSFSQLPAKSFIAGGSPRCIMGRESLSSIHSFNAFLLKCSPLKAIF